MAHEEHQYLDLIRKILNEGEKREGRNGATRSIFGHQMRFSLRDNTLPLFGTRRIFWRGILEELLFFISGRTQTRELEQKGVKIWSANTSREFLDSCGKVDYDVGEMGPMYGHQWRNWGGDQLQKCIDLIRNDPGSRRIIMSAWNADELDDGVLHPCHILVQFYVHRYEHSKYDSNCGHEHSKYDSNCGNSRGRLSCQVYQRSADVALGLPFNVASYSALTHMMAKICGLDAGELVHTIGDAHIYEPHIEPIKRILDRAPPAFPKISIRANNGDSIDSIKFDDVEIRDYSPHKGVKMNMVA